MSNFIEYQYGLDEECKTPIEKCRAKGGPATCRWHNWANVKFHDLSEIAMLTENDETVKVALSAYSRPTAEAVKRTAAIVHEELGKIRERFPRLNIGEIHIVNGTPNDELKEAGLYIGGMAKDGSRRDIIVIGEIKEASGYSFMRPDERRYGDAFRHEFGHYLTRDYTKSQLEYYESEMIDKMGAMAFEKYVRENISAYALEGGWKERVAELFSAYTSDEGDRLILNEHIKFIEECLVREVDNDYMDGFGMDAKEGAENMRKGRYDIIVEHFCGMPGSDWTKKSVEEMAKVGLKDMDYRGNHGGFRGRSKYTRADYEKDVVIYKCLVEKGILDKIPEYNLNR